MNLSSELMFQPSKSNVSNISDILLGANKKKEKDRSSLNGLWVTQFKSNFKSIPKCKLKRQKDSLFLRKLKERYACREGSIQFK